MIVVAFSPEEEQDMVEWLESNPILYNRKFSSYKETVKKTETLVGESCGNGEDS